ncbi:MAG: hypothetical protein ABI548_21840 [Polyangiaceae bacterium]
MTQDPHVLWEDLAHLWSRAAHLAADLGALRPLRGRAASLARVLAVEISEDDHLALRAVDTATACAESFPAAHDLLIAAREVSVDPALLVGPVLKLCASAHEAGHHDTVVVALLELLEIEALDCNDVPAAWLTAACSVSGEADYFLRRLVRRWVELFGAENDGIRAVVRERADVWFPTRRFRIDVLRALHAAEPTASGWVALALRRDEMSAAPLALSFGDRHEQATSTLRGALLRVLPAAAHAALEGWLRELST